MHGHRPLFRGVLNARAQQIEQAVVVKESTFGFG